MKVWKNAWWWITVLVFALHQLAERVLNLELGLLDNYLDPFLAAPILLGFWLLERQLVFKIPQLSWFETTVATMVLAVIFEEVFPVYEEGFRRDLVDYCFYGLGAVYFFLLINRPSAELASSAGEHR